MDNDSHKKHGIISQKFVCMGNGMCNHSFSFNGIVSFYKFRNNKMKIGSIEKILILKKELLLLLR